MVVWKDVKVPDILPYRRFFNHVSCQDAYQPFCKMPRSCVVEALEIQLIEK